MNIVFMASIAIFIVVVVASVRGCPSGWTQGGETCYYFSEMTETWTGAASFCKEFGAMLAEPNDQNKIQFLQGEGRSKQLTYFIGGSDHFVEGEWIWSSTMTRIDVSNWTPGEPNDEGHHEDCLVILPTGKWNDNFCKANFNFICEMDGNVRPAR